MHLIKKTLLAMLIAMNSITIMAGTEPTHGFRMPASVLPLGSYPVTVANQNFGGWHISANPSSIPDYLITEGTAVWNTSDNQLYVYNGTIWELMELGGDYDTSVLEARAAVIETDVADNSSEITTLAGNLSTAGGSLASVMVTANNNADNITDANAVIAANTQSISSNILSINAGGVEMGVMSDNIASNTACLDDGRTRLNGVTDEVHANDADIVTIAAAIGGNDNELAILTSSVNSGNTRMNAAESSIVVLTASANNGANAVANLQSSVDDNTAGIGSNDNELAILTSSVNSGDTRMTAAEASIVVLTASANNGTAAVANLQSSVDDNTASSGANTAGIGSNDNELAILTSSVDDNTASSGANTAGISELWLAVNYELPVVAFSIGNQLYEQGYTIPSLSLTFTVNKNVVSREYTGDHVASLGAGAGYAYSKANVAVNSTFHVVVTDDDGATSTDSIAVTFKNRTYVGASGIDPMTISGANIAAMPAKWETKATNGSVSLNNQRIFVAFPKRLGTPTSFALGGFGTSAWPRREISITNSNGFVEIYYVYYTQYKNTAPGGMSYDIH